ncbi:MAG: hypothetical protein JNJ54_26535 [Myxococcaceae bacterium]|nr:hypothetical protein [Myxococcaceae bacterium]
MIVAVGAVRVMQVPPDEEVDVVSVRDRLVSAASAVDVALLVSRALVRGGARRGVPAVHLDHALIDVPGVGVVQVALVEVIDVIAVADGRVPAPWAVDVLVAGVGVVGHDRVLSLVLRGE